MPAGIQHHLDISKESEYASDPTIMHEYTKVSETFIRNCQWFSFSSGSRCTK